MHPASERLLLYQERGEPSGSGRTWGLSAFIVVAQPEIKPLQIINTTSDIQVAQMADPLLIFKLFTII